jgi:hypothetical protein
MQGSSQPPPNSRGKGSCAVWIVRVIDLQLCIEFHWIEFHSIELYCIASIPDLSYFLDNWHLSSPPLWWHQTEPYSTVVRRHLAARYGDYYRSFITTSLPLLYICVELWTLIAWHLISTLLFFTQSWDLNNLKGIGPKTFHICSMETFSRYFLKRQSHEIKPNQNKTLSSAFYLTVKALTLNIPESTVGTRYT